MQDAPRVQGEPEQASAARLLLVIGLVLLACVPLFYSRLTYHRAYLKVVALQVGSLAIFMAGLAGSASLRRSLFPRVRLAWSLWTWLGVQVASVFLLEHRWLAVSVFAQSLPAILSTVLLMRLLTEFRREARGFAYAFAVVVALVVIVLLTVRDPNDVEFVPFSNRNMAGTFLILPIAVSMAFLMGIERTGFTWRWGAATATVIGSLVFLAASGYALWLTRCLAATLGCVVALYVIALALFPALRKPVLWGTATGAVVAAAIVILAPGLRKSVWESVYQSTAGIRLLMWGGAMRAAIASRGLGTGVGSFFVSYSGAELPIYYAHPNAAVAVYEAHNWWLHTTVEAGFAGLLALGWLHVESLKAGWRAWKRSAGSRGLVNLGLLATLTGIYTDALFSTSPHAVETQIIFYLILVAFGVSEADAAPREPGGRSADLFVRWALGPIAVGLTAVVIFGGVRWLPLPGGFLPEVWLSRGIRLQESAERALIEQQTERAAELLNSAAESLRRAHAFASDPQVFIASALHLAAVYTYRGDVAEAVALHLELENLVPGFGYTDRNMASLHAGQGQWDEAAERLLRYLRKNRFDVDAYRRLLLVVEDCGMNEIAREAVLLLRYAVPRSEPPAERRLMLEQVLRRFEALASTPAPWQGTENAIEQPTPLPSEHP